MEHKNYRERRRISVNKLRKSIHNLRLKVTRDKRIIPSALVYLDRNVIEDSKRLIKLNDIAAEATRKASMEARTIDHERIFVKDGFLVKEKKGKKEIIKKINAKYLKVGSRITLSS